MNDVVVSKVASLQRCIRRAREEHAASAGAFATDLTRRDAAILNVTCACELAIDLANHTIKIRRLGIPPDRRESLQPLVEADLLPRALGDRLKAMVGFCNAAVHDDGTPDVGGTERVIVEGLDDLSALGDRLRKALAADG